MSVFDHTLQLVSIFVGLTELACIGIHTDPDKAKEEVENLITVGRLDRFI
jgi:hypothetical protein